MLDAQFRRITGAFLGGRGMRAEAQGPKEETGCGGMDLSVAMG